MPILPQDSTLVHVTAVKEIKSVECKWQIVQLLKTLCKACFAQYTITRRKCVMKIVQNGQSTPTSTYAKLSANYPLNMMALRDA